MSVTSKMIGDPPMIGNGRDTIGEMNIIRSVIRYLSMLMIGVKCLIH